MNRNESAHRRCWTIVSTIACTLLANPTIAADRRAGSGCPAATLAQERDRLVARKSIPRVSAPPRSEAELLNLYHRLKTEGKLASAEGAATERELISLIDKTLKRNFPEASPNIWKAMTLDERLAILEGKVAAPGTRRSAEFAPIADHKRVLSDPAVQAFKRKNRRFELVTSDDNRRFISLAEDEGRKGRLFFSSENSVLKQLNDKVILDKEAVNALSNRYKALLYEKIISHPALKSKILAWYADWKGFSIVLSEDTPELAAAAGKAYEEVARAFAREIEALPIIELSKGRRGILGDPASWFLSGFSETADEANTAARLARSFHSPGGTATVDFRAKIGVLDERLTRIADYRAKLQAWMSDRPGIMVPSRLKASRQVLSEEAIEILRKVDAKDFEEYVQVVQSKFKKRFGAELTREEVLAVRDYQSALDVFMAGIRIEERVMIDLGKAEHGIVSMDFAGQNARNVRTTMEYLAEVEGKGAREAVRRARHAVRQASGEMRKMGENLEQAVDAGIERGGSGEIRYSGDDGIYMPSRALSRAGKAAFVHDLAKRPLGTRFRITFLPRKYASGGVIPGNQRSLLIVQAESFEKSLVEHMEGKVAFQRLRRSMFAVDLVPEASGGGTVNIVIGGEIDAALVEQTRQSLQAILPEGYRMGEIIPASSPPARPTRPVPAPVPVPASQGLLRGRADSPCVALTQVSSHFS